MIPTEVREAAEIARLAATLLLRTSDSKLGRAGADLRRVCGDMQANAERYINNNTIGAKLSECFVQARLTGATLDELNRIRGAIVAEEVVSLVATLIKQACVNFCLQQMSLVLVGMTFTSREDVVYIRGEINAAFDQAEEVAADEMALVVYKALVSLHAAVTFHLYETARPLPQMLRYQFGAPRPTLVLSHRLYATAARADELREENKVVHPAFAPRAGQALSF
jgi:hypothetical protein